LLTEDYAKTPIRPLSNSPTGAAAEDRVLPESGEVHNSKRFALPCWASCQFLCTWFNYRKLRFPVAKLARHSSPNDLTVVIDKSASWQQSPPAWKRADFRTGLLHQKIVQSMT
jgi:hypothetical protein